MTDNKEPKYWFVLRDFKKFNAKNPAYKVLPELGVECFTPMHWTVVKKKDGTMDRVYVPVMQNLLFAHATRASLDPVIRDTDKLQYQFARGTLQGTPMIVPDADMERFVNAVNTDSSTIYYTPSELTPDMVGKEIIVTGGPLDGYTGKLLKMQGSKKKRLIVELKGYFAAAVEVNPEYVKLVK